jgi:DNA-binding protein YbaB
VDPYEHVEQLIADYQQTRSLLADVHRQLANLEVTARSEDRLVEVTVGPHGNIVNVVIAEGAYRQYAELALAREIKTLSTQAGVAAASKAVELIAPVLPEDVDPGNFLQGKADLRPEECRPVESVPRHSAYDEDDFDENDYQSNLPWFR